MKLHLPLFLRSSLLALVASGPFLATSAHAAAVASSEGVLLSTTSVSSDNLPIYRLSKINSGSSAPFVIRKYTYNESSYSLTQLNYSLTLDTVTLGSTAIHKKDFAWQQNSNFNNPTSYNLVNVDRDKAHFFINYSIGYLGAIGGSGEATNTSTDAITETKEGIYIDRTATKEIDLPGLYVTKNYSGGGLRIARQYYNHNGLAVDADFIGCLASAVGEEYASAFGGGLCSAPVKNDRAESDYVNLGSVRGNFIGNTAQGEEYVGGGGLYANSGTIDNVNGHFIGNTAMGLDSSSSLTRGGALYYDSISEAGSITGDFIGNTAFSKSSAEGGAMVLDSVTKIGDIQGDFIGNLCHSYDGSDISRASGGARGGAINMNGVFRNELDLNKVMDIKGDFVDNKAYGNIHAYGAGIYMVSSAISKLEGDFVRNWSETQGTTLGGGLSITSGSQILSIKGHFIENHALSNSGYTEASGDVSRSLGGGIYITNSTIHAIEGDFVRNYTQMNSPLASELSQGGAVYLLRSTIREFSGNIIGNYAVGADAQGGGIYNSMGTFVMKSNSVSGNLLVQGNYYERNGTRTSNFYYGAGIVGETSTLKLNAMGGTTITIADKIDGTSSGKNHQYLVINETSDSNSSTVTIANTVSRHMVNVNHGTLNINSISSNSSLGTSASSGSFDNSDVFIHSSATLRVAAGNINHLLTNNSSLSGDGTLSLQTGTLLSSLSEYNLARYEVAINQNVTTNTSLIDKDISNKGIITLTGGTLEKTITAAHNNSEIHIASNATVDSELSYLNDNVRNAGTLILGSGTLTQEVQGSGSSKTVIQDGVKLHSDIDKLQDYLEVQDGGILHLSDGTITKNIQVSEKGTLNFEGTGDVVLADNVTITGNVEGNLTGDLTLENGASIVGNLSLQNNAVDKANLILKDNASITGLVQYEGTLSLADSARLGGISVANLTVETGSSNTIGYAQVTNLTWLQGDASTLILDAVDPNNVVVTGSLQMDGKSTIQGHVKVVGADDVVLGSQSTITGVYTATHADSDLSLSVGASVAQVSILGKLSTVGSGSITVEQGIAAGSLEVGEQQLSSNADITISENIVLLHQDSEININDHTLSAQSLTMAAGSRIVGNLDAGNSDSFLNGGADATQLTSIVGNAHFDGNLTSSGHTQISGSVESNHLLLETGAQLTVQTGAVITNSLIMKEGSHIGSVDVGAGDSHLEGGSDASLTTSIHGDASFDGNVVMSGYSEVDGALNALGTVARKDAQIQLDSLDTSATLQVEENALIQTQDTIAAQGNISIQGTLQSQAGTVVLTSQGEEGNIQGSILAKVGSVTLDGDQAWSLQASNTAEAVIEASQIIIRQELYTKEMSRLHGEITLQGTIHKTGGDLLTLSAVNRGASQPEGSIVVGNHSQLNIADESQLASVQLDGGSSLTINNQLTSAELRLGTNASITESSLIHVDMDFSQANTGNIIHDRIITDAISIDAAGASIKLTTLDKADETKIDGEQQINLFIQSDGVSASPITSLNAGTFVTEVDHDMESLNAHMMMRPDGSAYLLISENYKGAEGNRNQEAVAGVLENLASPPPADSTMQSILDALGQTSSEAAALAALDSLGGQGHIGVKKLLTDSATNHMQALRANQRHLMQQLSLQDGKFIDTFMTSFQATGGREDWSDSGFGNSYQSTSYGGMFLAGRRLNNNWSIAYDFAYNRDEADSADMEIESDSYYFDVTLGYRNKCFSQSLSVGVGLYSIHTDRYLSIQTASGGLLLPATGSNTAMSFNISYEAQHQLTPSKSPHSCSAIFLADASFGSIGDVNEESAGNAGLEVRYEDIATVTLGAGVRYRFDYKINQSNGVFMADLLYVCDLGNRDLHIENRFLGDSARFRQESADPARHGVRASLYSSIPMSSRWSAFGQISADIKPDESSWNTSVGISFSF